jgi:hypothetical protein
MLRIKAPSIGAALSARQWPAPASLRRAGQEGDTTVHAAAHGPIWLSHRETPRRLCRAGAERARGSRKLRRS